MRRLLLVFFFALSFSAAVVPTMAQGPVVLHRIAVSGGGACAVGVDISNGWCQVAHGITATSNTTSAAVTIDSTGADAIVVVVNSYSGGVQIVTADVTDNKGNSWLGGVQKDDSGVNTLLLVMKPTTVGSSHTFTVNNATPSFPVIEVYAVSGSHASPIDQTGVGVNTGTTGTVASITPSQNNELIISGWTNGGVNTGTRTASSMTVADFHNGTAATAMAGGLAYATQSTAAAISPTWTYTDSGVSTAVTLSLKHS